MHDRIWSVLFAVSLIVMGVCGTLTGINYIVAGDDGAGFLPDIAVRAMGIASGAGLFLCVFSRIKQNQRHD